MWTAEIESKEFVKGSLQIGVIFTNGTEKFTELYLIRANSELGGLISSRLDQLNNLTTDVTLGEFTPAIKTPPVVADPFQSALSELNRLKQLVDLGVITDTDPAYVTALNNAKTNFK